jgi:hypothetical protein
MITGDAITLEAWVYKTALNTVSLQENLMDKSTKLPTRAGYFLGIHDPAGEEPDSWEFNISNGTDEGCYLIVPFDMSLLNQWFHVAGVALANTLQLYINGQLVGEMDTCGEQVTPNTLDLVLGRWSPIDVAYFLGILDEVRISNVARYDANFTPPARFAPDANTMALWHMDEGQGLTIYDASGNGNNGTISGAMWVEGQ